jgi:hypothetical protein
VNQCSQDDQNKNPELAEHRPTGSVADNHKAGEQSEMLSDLRQRGRTKGSQNPGLNRTEISRGKETLHLFAPRDRSVRFSCRVRSSLFRSRSKFRSAFFARLRRNKERIATLQRIKQQGI